MTTETILSLGDEIIDPSVIAVFNADRLEAINDYGFIGEHYLCRMGYCEFQYRNGKWFLFSRY